MGLGWVCQFHRAMPWKGPYACECGAPGAPCGSCTEPKDRGAANLTNVFEVDLAVDWRPCCRLSSGAMPRKQNHPLYWQPEDNDMQLDMSGPAASLGC